MICQEAREWIMNAEEPARFALAPAPIAAHLPACAACQSLVARLGRFEQAWRDQPLPDAAAQSKARFLAGLPSVTKPGVTRVRNRIWSPPRWAMAASLLFVCLVSFWLVAGRQTAQANTDVIEQLIDWNLEISNTPAEQRGVVFAREATLRRSMNQSRLSEDDRSFAESLLQTGADLARTTEGVDEIDHLHNVADRLVERLGAATARNDPKAADKHARHYERIAQRNRDKVARLKSAPPKGDKKQKLDKVLAREQRRQERLESLHQNAPAPTKKAVRRMLDQSKKAVE